MRFYCYFLLHTPNSFAFLSIALQRALNNSPCGYLFILPCTICFLTTEAFYVSIVQYNYYFRHTNRMIRITALFCFYAARYRKEGFCYMYSKKQRILAIIGIAALVLLYIITLICAIFNFDGAGRMFKVSLFATIFIPIILWLYIWMYGKLTNKHTIADFDNMPATKAIKDQKQKEEAEQVTLSKKNTRS